MAGCISIVTAFIGIYLGIKKGISITNSSWLKEGFWQKYIFLTLPSNKKFRGEIISGILFIIVVCIVTVIVGEASILFVYLLKYISALIASLLGILMNIFISPAEPVLSMLAELQGFFILISLGSPNLFFSIVVIPLVVFTIMFIAQVIHIVLLDWIVDKRIVSGKLQE